MQIVKNGILNKVGIRKHDRNFESSVVIATAISPSDQKDTGHGACEIF
jgi:hypothetical protein